MARILKYLPKIHYVTKYPSRKSSSKKQTFYYKCERCGIECTKGYDKFYMYESRGTLLCEKHRREETWLIKYGTINPSALSEIKEKVKATMREKYGVDYAAQNKDIFDKVKQTNRIKYGVDLPLQNSDIKEKLIKTNNKKYGGNAPICSEDVKEKTKKTNIEKYGNEWQIASDDTKQKIESSFIKEYNSTSFMLTDEFKVKSKESIYKKYGVDHIMHNRNIYDKMHNTMKEKYGVLHALQNDTLCEKAQVTYYEHFGEKRLACVKYKYNNIYFNSSWELAFYLYCINKNIKIEREPRFFEYYFNGKKHKYYPDFRVPCGYVELKSDYLFDLMQKENTKDNAKYKCMLDNNISIFLEKDIKNIVDWAKINCINIFNESLYSKNKY